MPDEPTPDEHRYRYAERMFPPPVDLGIAQLDRAVSSVPFGTSSYLEGKGGAGTRWYEGGGGANEEAVAEMSSTRRRAACRHKATRSSR